MGKIVIVNGIIIRNKSEILTVKKGDYFILPGGKIEVNETDKQALLREVMEETGLTMLSAQKFNTYLHTQAMHNPEHELEMRSYLIEVSGDPTPQAEISEILWVDFETFNRLDSFPKRWWKPIFDDLIQRGLLQQSQ